MNRDSYTTALILTGGVANNDGNLSMNKHNINDTLWARCWRDAWARRWWPRWSRWNRQRGNQHATWPCGTDEINGVKFELLEWLQETAREVADLRVTTTINAINAYGATLPTP